MALPGYLGVYVITDHEFIALKLLDNGYISIDYYESNENYWKVVGRIKYDEILNVER